MAELGALREAVAAVKAKVDALVTAVAEFKASSVAQEEIDEIRTSVEEIGTEIDGIIEDLTGPEAPAEGEAPA